MVHGLANRGDADGRAATRARRTSTPRHSALERLNTQPTVLKYDGIASEEVGCSETPGYPLLHAAEGDRLRLSTIGLPDTSERVAFSIVCPGSWATMTFLALPLAD